MKLLVPAAVVAVLLFLNANPPTTDAEQWAPGRLAATVAAPAPAAAADPAPAPAAVSPSTSPPQADAAPVSAAGAKAATLPSSTVATTVAPVQSQVAAVEVPASTTPAADGKGVGRASDWLAAQGVAPKGADR